LFGNANCATVCKSLANRSGIEATLPGKLEVYSTGLAMKKSISRWRQQDRLALSEQIASG
jgi:hypothetical protein